MEWATAAAVGCSVAAAVGVSRVAVRAQKALVAARRCAPSTWPWYTAGVSRVLGLADVVGGWVNTERFLDGGAGDAGVYDGAFELGFHVLEHGVEVDEATVVLEAGGEAGGGLVQYALTMGSPAAGVLPDAAQAIVAEVVGAGLRADAQSGDEVVGGRDVVIHCPMTGDVDARWRREKYARPLAEEAGVVSVILVAPGYGPRRPAEWAGKYGIPDVGMLAAQGAGVFTEARAVAEWARRCGAASVTYAGVSFGGAMATMASLLDKGTAGLAATVACHSPGPPFREGILARTIPWAAMGGPESDVGQLLAGIGTDALVARDFPPHWYHAHGGARVARFLYAAHDLYIPAHSSKTLYDVVAAHPLTRAAARAPLVGGHAWAILACSRAHVDSIVEVVGELRRL